MRKFLGIVPARQGSKGLPGKNTMDLLGRPLISWTFDAALRAPSLDKLICSTDDNLVEMIAEGTGVTTVKRPRDLASDEASMVDVLLHVAEIYPDFSDLVLLQPTSPLRTAGDIERALEIAKENPSFSVISITRNRKTPFWSYKKNSGGVLEFLFENGSTDRRQTLPESFMPNGAIYIVGVERLKELKSFFVSGGTLPYEMPSERSIDIDDEFDFRIAGFLAQSNL